MEKLYSGLENITSKCCDEEFETATDKQVDNKAASVIPDTLSRFSQDTTNIEQRGDADWTH